MVITDQDKKDLIAAAYRKVGEGYLRQAATAEQDAQTQRVYESALSLSQLLEKVPAMVIPCVKKDYDPTSGNAVAASVYGSIIPATWSFQLALRSRGLGSVFTTLHLFQDKVVAEALGIPDDVLQIALLPVAYTIGTDFKPAERPPVEQITFWNEWGQS
jgi:nitroreductase